MLMNMSSAVILFFNYRVSRTLSTNADSVAATICWQASNPFLPSYPDTYEQVNAVGEPKALDRNLVSTIKKYGKQLYL